MSIVCLAQSAPAAGTAASANSATASSTAHEALPPNTVILKVGDRQITKEQFERYIADLEGQQGPADLSREKLGDNYASLLMLSQQALDNHLDTSPTVIRLLAIDRTQILSNAEYDKLKMEAKPTPEQISKYYNAHLDDYDVVLLRRVFIWKKSAGNPKGLDPADAQALATAIKAAYAAGTDPHKVVKNPETVVIDAAPLKFQRGEMPQEMEKVAFSMTKPSEWAVLANRNDALVLLQMVSRSRRSLSDVSPLIEKKLQNQKLRDDLDALKKNTGIWLDEAYFSSHDPISNPDAPSEASGPGKSGSERGER
jgi:hypothetical protein